MARTYTYTRTSTNEPENNNNIVSSLKPPTREEIITQLEKHFAEHPNDIVTHEDISKIADEVNNSFEELRDKPYGSFAKYVPQKPHLSISMYPNDWLLCDRERYPADYSPLYQSDIQCSTIRFSVTVIVNTKQISLAYVSTNYC